MRVRDLRQLFNSLDATPFPETDLDAEAEEFIMEWAKELRSDSRIRIRIHVERPLSDSETVSHVTAALHSFFAYRTEIIKRRFRLLIGRGRLSLIIGLSCLAASVVGANQLRQFGEGTLLAIVRESLIIGGWVAMWGPLEILLYTWWPLRHELRVCERLASAIIEIVPATTFELTPKAEPIT